MIAIRLCAVIYLAAQAFAALSPTLAILFSVAAGAVILRPAE